MSFTQDFPEYAAIEPQIRRAGAQRSVYVAHAIVDMLIATWRGLGHVGDFFVPLPHAHARQFPGRSGFRAARARLLLVVRPAG